MFVVDEVHRLKRSEVWNILSGSLMKPNSQLIGLSTAGDPNQKRQILNQLYEYGKQVSLGKFIDETFLFRCWQLPDDADWTDPANWHYANPALGQNLKMDDLESIFAQEMETGHESSWRRLHCNQFVTLEDNWKIVEEFKLLAVPGEKLRPKDEVVLAFDGSASQDSTVLLACRTADNYIEIVDMWARPLELPADAKWYVDVEDVMAAVRDACSDYRVKRIVCDAAGWKYPLSVLLNEGYPIEAYPQSPSNMVPAIKQFEYGVRSGEISHNGDPELIEHIGNVTLRYQRTFDGYMIAKDKRSPLRKIDAAVCAVMAYDEVLNAPVENDFGVFAEAW